MNLRLVLTHHWFSETESGRKRIEYRRLSDYWTKRILGKKDLLKTVTFTKGYTNIGMTFIIDKIDVGGCPYDGWQGEYIRIYFKET